MFAFFRISANNKIKLFASGYCYIGVNIETHVSAVRNCAYRSAHHNDRRNRVVTPCRTATDRHGTPSYRSISANRVQQHSGLAGDLVCSHREVANEVTACRFRKQSNPALTASKSSDDPPRPGAAGSKARTVQARPPI